MSIHVWVDEGVKVYHGATGWSNDSGFLTVWNGSEELAEYAPGWRGVWTEEETNANSGT